MTVKLNFPHITEYKDTDKDTRIEPMCVKGNMNLAITNRGELIPCCKCDTRENMENPEFRKMIDRSRIADYDSIEDIIESDVWKQFYDQLKQNRGPKACWDACRTNKPDSDKQEMVYADESGKLRIWERK